jgi:hypothetical protein
MAASDSMVPVSHVLGDVVAELGRYLTARVVIKVRVRMLVDAASPTRVIAVGDHEEPHDEESEKDQASAKLSYREWNWDQCLHRYFSFLTVAMTSEHRARTSLRRDQTEPYRSLDRSH